MTVKVRFAPSPTGRLHIGGVRTALYCYLYAKAQGGRSVLRIEDTDTERGKEEYEQALKEDLKWLGLRFDEGPYRQSERKDIYGEAAQGLVKKGKAYPCFLSPEELESLTNRAKEEKRPPHFYHGRFRDLPPKEAAERAASGEKHTIRFKNPQKAWILKDVVRGKVRWEKEMVGDFVIIRTGGMPVYNFCCVVDDILMEITHVIRASDHLNNTLRQLLLYEALGETPPAFAHCSILVGKDGKKLSKRDGAMAVSQYREEGYLPTALLNYLCLLGWGHPERKDVFDPHTLGKAFSLDRLTRPEALYDRAKLDFINGQHLRSLGDDKLVDLITKALGPEHPFHGQGLEWKQKACRLFVGRINKPGENHPPPWPSLSGGDFRFQGV